MKKAIVFLIVIFACQIGFADEYITDKASVKKVIKKLPVYAINWAKIRYGTEDHGMPKHVMKLARYLVDPQEHYRLPVWSGARPHDGFRKVEWESTYTDVDGVKVVIYKKGLIVYFMVDQYSQLGFDKEQKKLQKIVHLFSNGYRFWKKQEGKKTKISGYISSAPFSFNDLMRKTFEQNQKFQDVIKENFILQKGILTRKEIRCVYKEERRKMRKAILQAECSRGYATRYVGGSYQITDAKLVNPITGFARYK